MKKEVVMSYPGFLKMFFFWAGLIATFAYRIIIVLNFYSPYWVKVFWYIGTIGFIFYFGYRFDIQRRESDLIRDHDLLKVVKNSGIRGKKKKVLEYVVENGLKSKAKWNSLFIFGLSIVALLVGIFLDLGILAFN